MGSRPLTINFDNRVDDMFIGFSILTPPASECDRIKVCQATLALALWYASPHQM